MSFTYLKNPIVLGLIGAVAAYLYMYWLADKKYKEKKTVTREQVNIFIPCAIGIVVWFGASYYLDNDGNGNNSNSNSGNASDSNSNSGNATDSNSKPNTSPQINMKHIGGSKLTGTGGTKGEVRTGNKISKNIESINNSSIHTISTGMANKLNPYHLIGKNKIRLPPTDVFIDIAKF